MILFLASKPQPNVWVTYRPSWFFSGGSIRGEGICLVQNRLGEGAGHLEWVGLGHEETAA